MHTNFNVGFLFCIAIAVAFCLQIIIVIWRVRRVTAVTKAHKKSQLDSGDYTDHVPAVTIVIYARNEGQNLCQNLPYFLNQQYSNYDVVVVDDASEDNTAEILSEAMVHYKNLHKTFVPREAHNVSRRKLSIMLGIKAASGEIIVVTNGNCCPQSDQWLPKLIRNFTSETEVVLGYSYPNYANDKAFGNLFRAFDYLNESAQYLASALHQHPYRGTNCNIAFRKDTFFKNKGFSHSMNLNYGDDDIFVNEITNSTNTQVELSSDSQMSVHYNMPHKAYHEHKLRHDFNAKYLPRMPFVSTKFILLCNYAFFAALAIALTCDIFSIVGVTAVALLAIISWTVHGILSNKLAKALHGKAIIALLPIFALWKPIHSVIYYFNGKATRKHNYTWPRR